MRRKVSSKPQRACRNRLFYPRRENPGKPMRIRNPGRLGAELEFELGLGTSPQSCPLYPVMRSHALCDCVMH